MKLQQLIGGIASGYVTKAAQFIAAIALVPFLLREEVLGLDGYGRVFTILAIITAPRLLFDGLRLSFIRRISTSIDSSDDRITVGDAIGTAIKVSFFAYTPLILAIAVPSAFWLQLTGIPVTDDSSKALWIAALLAWLENVFVFFSTPLFARGSITFVNFVGAFEAIGRTLTYFVVFSWISASLTSYFLIQVLFIILRQGAVVIFLSIRWPDDLRGFSSAPVRMGGDDLRSSLSVTSYMSANQIVCRVPVVLANRFLGAAEAGLFALVIDTMRRYVIQILFSVLQPIAIPLAARLDPRVLAPARKEILFRLESLYTLGIGLVVATTITCMPALVHWWLGAAYGPIVFPAQIFLCACGFEIVFSFRQSVLIGQGLLGAATPLIVGAAVGSVAAAAASALLWNSWFAMVLVVGAYLVVANALAIGRTFDRAMEAQETAVPTAWRQLFFLSLAGISAIFVGQWVTSTSVTSAVVLGATSAALTTMIAHFSVIALPTAVATLKKLRYSLSRDILDG